VQKRGAPHLNPLPIGERRWKIGKRGVYVSNSQLSDINSKITKHGG